MLSTFFCICQVLPRAYLKYKFLSTKIDLVIQDKKTVKDNREQKLKGTDTIINILYLFK